MKNFDLFFNKDLISIEDLTNEDIEIILDFAKDIKKNPEKYHNTLHRKIMIPLFFEPSTRTSTSFQAAMTKLGGSVIDFDVLSSSVLKGENLKDTLKIISGYYPDFVVIRHKRDGSARFAADLLDIPVINAGDGQNQHPTQTLLDLFSINEIFGKIEGIKIAIAGDLKYGRTAHSLAISLSRYKNCEIFFLSPESLRMPKYFLNKLKENNCNYLEYNISEINNIIKKCDLIYMTRIQRERFPEGVEGEQEYLKVSKEYYLNLDMLKGVKSGFRIMHPLPKVGEIDDKIDNTDFAYYFTQAENGLYVRQALLILIGGINL
ncbi:MAG: aspartate carbamoyltransferase [Candidatus Pacearchaeota archaeon]